MKNIRKPLLNEVACTVIYSSLQEMIAEGCYHRVAKEIINEKNFPIPQDKKGIEERILIRLYHSFYDADIDQMQETIEKDGNRPVTLFELLAFGQKFRNQCKWPDSPIDLMALGSSWNNYFPVIRNDSYNNNLGHREYGRDLEIYNSKDFIAGYVGSWFNYFPAVVMSELL